MIDNLSPTINSHDGDDGITRWFKYTVTPEQAEQWLEERNHGNRALRIRQVEKLTRDMAGGNFVYNYQPIIFDDNGLLIQGQHRLTACVISGAPFVTDVVWGAVITDHTSMDAVAKRAFRDQLKRDYPDVANAKAIEGMISRLWRFASGESRSTKTPTSAEAMAIYRNDPEGCAEAVRRAGTFLGHKRVRVVAPVLSTMFYCAYQVDPDMAEVFFHRLDSGIGLTDGHAILALRDGLNNMRFDIVKAGEPVRRDRALCNHAVLILGWNMFRAGASVKRLVWNGYDRNGLAVPFPCMDGWPSERTPEIIRGLAAKHMSE